MNDIINEANENYDLEDRKEILLSLARCREHVLEANTLLTFNEPAKIQKELNDLQERNTTERMKIINWVEK